MRCVILAAAVVLLVIAADVTGYEFGDIVYYEPTEIFEGCSLFKFRHVGVYVGDVAIKGKKPGEDIFERFDENPSCVFSKLSDDPRKHGVCNYLDGYVNQKKELYTKGSVQDMKDRIEKLVDDCGDYKVFSNNCEHLATYVRYGRKIAMQEGLIGQGVCFNDKDVKRFHMLRFIKRQKKAGNLKCELKKD